MIEGIHFKVFLLLHAKDYMLVCLCMVANVAGAHWLCTKKPWLTEVSSSSDSCLELATYTASKPRDYLFPTAQFHVTIKPSDRQALPIHIRLPFLVRSIRYIPFLGLWDWCITRTLGSFHTPRTTTTDYLHGHEVLIYQFDSTCL